MKEQRRDGFSNRRSSYRGDVESMRLGCIPERVGPSSLIYVWVWDGVSLESLLQRMEIQMSCTNRGLK